MYENRHENENYLKSIADTISVSPDTILYLLWILYNKKDKYYSKKCNRKLP